MANSAHYIVASDFQLDVTVDGYTCNVCAPNETAARRLCGLPDNTTPSLTVQLEWPPDSSYGLSLDGIQVEAQTGGISAQGTIGGNVTAPISLPLSAADPVRVKVVSIPGLESVLDTVMVGLKPDDGTENSDPQWYPLSQAASFAGSPAVLSGPDAAGSYTILHAGTN
jgi:hypothetical protein